MVGVMRICLFLIAVFVRNVVWAQVSASDFENSIVASSLMKNISEVHKHMRLLPGTLYETENINSRRYIGLTNFNTRLLSIDVDYARNRLFIYDFNTASIYAVENFNWKEEFSNLSLTHIHAGLSRYSTRIAVDWVSNNIYWTDGLFGWIVIQSGSKVNKYKILIDDDIEKPYALAVDPVNKYLFWSDIGSTVKIVRASLAGTDAKAIVTTGLAFPTSVDIDRTANYLVWVDSVRDTLETCNFDGMDRRVIRRLSHYSFYDVAVFKDLVAVTDWSNGTLLVFNKYTGQVLNNLYLTNSDPFLAVALYSSEIQPSQSDRCVSFGCSDICVYEETGPVCMCKEGYKLNQDGVYKICSEDLGTYHRAVMFSSATNICMMDFRSLTTNMHNDTVNCFLEGGTAISQFDIDMNDRMVVYIDGNYLISANIGTNPIKNSLVAAKGAITVWISGSVGSQKIEKAEMDGSNRVTLFTSPSKLDMKGLTVDSSTNTLYFIDDSQMKSCDFDGNQLTLLTPTTSVLAPTMILVYKNLLVVADNSFASNVIKVYEKKSEPVLQYQMSGIDLETLTDLHVLDPAAQPEKQGPCDILNGDCEQICIPIGRNRVCKCEYGYQLDIDKRTCVSNLLTDNFLVVTDWTHNAMYQVSIVNDDVRAIDTNTYGSPIAIAYNYLTPEVFWSTSVLIHRRNLKDHSYKVLFNTEFLGCHADRFAIDYPSGNIYYTANPTAQTGFVGVGVISPQGLHRRLITIGSQPRDIVLDSEEGVMFWTDHGSAPAFLAKANMDGTGISYVIRDGLSWPNGLAIDLQAKKLYVTDGKTDKIYKCSYFGVCTFHYTDIGSHLMDITMLDDYLYYTAWNRPYISKLHKTDPVGVVKVGYKPELGRLDSLALYSSLLNQSHSSECFSNKGLGPCSTFCLPKASRYVCACEDNGALRSDDKTCENVVLPVTTTRSVSMTSENTDKEGTTDQPSTIPTAAIAGSAIGVLVLVIVIIVIAFIIWKRSNNSKNDNSDRQGVTNVQFDYDIAYLTQTVQNPSRPDSTYDKPDDSRIDKDQHDYMKLNKRHSGYEKLSYGRNEVPMQNLRQHAVQNVYKCNPSISSNVPHCEDDFLKPSSHDSHNFSDDAEDLNNCIHKHSARSDINPKSQFPNVSTIT